MKKIKTAVINYILKKKTHEQKYILYQYGRTCNPVTSSSVRAAVLGGHNKFTSRPKIEFTPTAGVYDKVQGYTLFSATTKHKNGLMAKTLTKTTTQETDTNLRGSCRWSDKWDMN